MFTHDTPTAALQETYEDILSPQLCPGIATQLIDNTSATDNGPPMDLKTLQRHIKQGDFYAALLCYRPAGNPHGKITGAELLPRIVNSEEYSITGTSRFAGAATMHAKWSHISEVIIDHALDIARTIPDFHLSLNLSARMIDMGDVFVQKIRELLTEHDIRNPSLISFEVLESVDTLKGERAKVLRKIRDQGITLGLDDYGEGNSSTLLREMQEEDATPEILKVCSRITQTAGNGKKEIRKCLNIGLQKGIRHFIAEGSPEFPIRERDMNGLKDLQWEYGDDVMIEIEGPVIKE